MYAYRLEEIVKGGKQSRRCLDETMTINFYRIGLLRGAFFLVLSGVRKGVSRAILGLLSHVAANFITESCAALLRSAPEFQISQGAFI